MQLMRWNERLALYRGDQSYQEVARKAGLVASTVLNLEKGKGNIDTAIQVMEAGLGRNVGEAFVDEGGPLWFLG